MSTIDFFKKVGIAKLGNVGDSIVGWYAEHDPATASAADIASLGERAEALAHRIAEVQGAVENDQRIVNQLVEKLDRDKRAAVALGNRLQSATAAGDAVQVTALTAQINPVLAEIEKLAGEDGTGNTSGSIHDARVRLQTETNDLVQFHEAHTKAIDDWTGAETRLQAARAAMEHAARELDDAKRGREQAERDAGLLRGASSGSIALGAMEKRAQQLKIEANAARIQSNGLRQQGGASVDDIVNKALAGDAPAANSGTATLDRLARLTGKA
jgi:hypothetical protein